jgi:imidazole glycerol phosphate synthase glutamine amidotransferase subunit
VTLPVHVVRTGTANLASVLAGLTRAGGRPTLTDSPEDVRRADRVMLPGVGAFGAAAAELAAKGLIDALRERATAGRPTMGICLGMQLFAEHSEESPGVPGLGIVSRGDPAIPGRVGPHPAARLESHRARARLPPAAPGHVYFANSYRLARAPEGWHGALTTHGEPFVAALERAPCSCVSSTPSSPAPSGVNS